MFFGTNLTTKKKSGTPSQFFDNHGVPCTPYPVHRPMQCSVPVLWWPGTLTDAVQWPSALVARYIDRCSAVSQCFGGLVHRPVQFSVPVLWWPDTSTVAVSQCPGGPVLRPMQFSVPVLWWPGTVYPRNPYSRNPYFGVGISDQKPLIPTPGIPTILC